MGVLAAIYGKKLTQDMSVEEPADNPDTALTANDQRNIIFILSASAVVGALFGAVWLAVMKRCADSIIKVSMVISSIFLLAATAVAFLSGIFIMGIIYLIILIIQVIYFWLVRNRIPFAQATIGASAQAIQDYSGPIYVTYFVSALSIGWVAFWGFTFVAIYHATALNNGNTAGDPNESPSSGLNGVAYFLLLVSLYWTMEVLRNIGHVTTAGVVATWWFNPMAETATWGAFKRATTTSLGSICFGSLIVAVLQATRQILREAQRNAQREGNMGLAFLACCIGCCLSWIESLIEYFNMYAYTKVAFYGLDFRTAAKETWDLFKSRGFEMIINDDLTGMVLAMGCIIGAVITGIFGALWAAALNFDGWIVVGIIALVIGYIMVALIMNVIQSAVATTYVVWAEDSALLNQTRPEHYTKLRDAANLAYGNSGRW
jgi:hypothetical protein